MRLATFTLRIRKRKRKSQVSLSNTVTIRSKDIEEKVVKDETIKKSIRRNLPVNPYKATLTAQYE